MKLSSHAEVPATDTTELIRNTDMVIGLSTLGSTKRENANSAGEAWVGENYNIIKDNERIKQRIEICK